MGVVLRGRDNHLGRDVVLKTVRNNDVRMRRRFEREIKIAAQLEHPSIVPIHDSGEFEDGTPFYVMRHVRGEELELKIRSATSPTERLALLGNVNDLVNAMAYAHARGFVHRDLKPQNVLVGPFGETVVIDWGLAKLARKPESSDQGAPESSTVGPGTEYTSEAMGTKGYVAPEVLAGESATAHADVFSLGMILYRTVTGEPACAPLDLSVVHATLRRERVPRDLVAIVRRALAPGVSDRYPHAQALSNDLRRFSEGQLVDARDYGPLDRLLRAMRRNRVLVWSSAVSLMTFTILAAWSVSRIDRARANAVDALDVAKNANAVAFERRASAERLVDYALDDLAVQQRQRGKLGPQGRLVQEVEALYGAGDTLDPAASTRLGRAGAIRSRVLAESGHYEQAVAAALESLEHLRTVEEGADASAENLDVLVEILSDYAVLLAEGDRFDEALARSVEARAMALDAVSRYGETDHRRMLVAWAASTEMTVHMFRADYRSALLLAEQIRSDLQPSQATHGSGRRRRIRIDVNTALGRGALFDNRPADAVPYLRSAVLDAQREVDEQPYSAPALRLLGDKTFEWAQALALAGNIREAREAADELVRLREGQRTVEAGSFEVARKLSNARSLAGSLARAEGDQQASRALAVDDVEMWENWGGESSLDLRQYEGTSHVQLASALRASDPGEANEVRSAYTRGLELLSDAYANSEALETGERLAHAMGAAAEFELSMNESETALKHYRAAYLLKESLLSDRSGAWQRIELLRAKGLVAHAEWKSGRPSAARLTLNSVRIQIESLMEQGHELDALQPVLDAAGPAAKFLDVGLLPSKAEG